MSSINCKGELVSLDNPVVMGIINITPDSFFCNSRTDINGAIKRAKEMMEMGATFIDIGGYSSRPDAKDVSEQEEIDRVVPVVERLVKEVENIKISVDTFRTEVALESINAGAAIINDISGGHIDDKMWKVVAEKQVPFIAMHMIGTPQNMQQHTDYKDFIGEMFYYFSEIKKTAQEYGLNDLILDPGFGFSKTLEQNYELMRHLSDFKFLDCPLLVGISRKSMIYKLLGCEPTEALNGTTVLNTISLEGGANILRVHDVKEAVECVKIWKMMRNID